MSNIEQNLQNILTSRYGKDVRQSIHDSIHDCYEDGKAGAIDLVAREQIANLVANNNPTEGNSELIDIRVGADGKTYDSAGEAVREQINKTYKNSSAFVIGTSSGEYNGEFKTLSEIQYNGPLFLWANAVRAFTDVSDTIKDLFVGSNIGVYISPIFYSTSKFLLNSGYLAYVLAVDIDHNMYLFSKPDSHEDDRVWDIDKQFLSTSDMTNFITELQDIRVGADGKTYDSAGEAVREQINKTNAIVKAISVDQSIRLYNDDDLHKPSAVTNDAYIWFINYNNPVPAFSTIAHLMLYISSSSTETGHIQLGIWEKNDNGDLKLIQTTSISLSEYTSGAYIDIPIYYYSEHPVVLSTFDKTDTVNNGSQVFNIDSTSTAYYIFTNENDDFVSRNNIKYLNNYRYSAIIYAYSSISQKSVDEPDTSIIVVDKNGEYTSIQDAVNVTSETRNQIFIKNGVYEETIDVRQKSYPIHFTGESREGTILQNGIADYANPPMSICKGSLKNMTIKAYDDEIHTPDEYQYNNGSYAVHVDNNANAINGQLIIDNCYLTSEWNAAIGIGLYENQEIVIRNSFLESDTKWVSSTSYDSGINGALIVHGNARTPSKGQTLSLENCLLRSIQNNTVFCIMTYRNVSTDDITLRMYKNIFYSDISKSHGDDLIRLTRATAGDEWNGTDNIFLDGMSYMNSIPLFNAGN